MTPGAASLRMKHVGGPTLYFELGGVRFLTDPTFDPAGSEYKSGTFTLSKVSGPSISADQLQPIDVVLLSHDHHFDNFDRQGREFATKARTVFTTSAGADRLGGNAIGLEPWGERSVASPPAGNVRITATPARHGPAGGDRGPVIGFVVEGEGHTVYVSGDTVWFDGVDETLRRFPRIDVAVLFLGAAHVPVLPSHITFTAEEAVRVARAIPEATIVPVHYEGWKHFTESRREIERAFDSAGLADRLDWADH